MHRYLRIREVTTILHVDEAFLRSLAADDLIHIKETAEGDPVVSAEDVERARIVRTLMEDLDVNPAGVEVILHMRESMVAMRRQFADILEALVEEMRRQLGR